MHKLAQVNIGETFASPIGTQYTVGDLVTLIIRLAFVASGFLILVLFLVAGFQMVVGAGSGNQESAAKGRQAATAAVAGFLIVFVAYWVIRIIELAVGTPFITSGFVFNNSGN